LKKRILISAFLFCFGSFSLGVLTRDYGTSVEKMTRVVRMHDCCSGSPLASILYSQQASDLSGISAKAKKEKLTDLDWATLTFTWWYWRATDEFAAYTAKKHGVTWVEELNQDLRASAAALLKEGGMTWEDVSALHLLFNEAVAYGKPGKITKEQERQLAYLLKRSPELSLEMNSVYRNLIENLRDNGLSILDLYQHIGESRDSRLFDTFVLCKLRPSLPTSNPNKSFMDCVRGR
jgi:hypothetical protein